VKQDAVLSQGGPRDAAVNFDRYQILQRHLAVSLPQHGFPVLSYISDRTNQCSRKRVQQLQKSKKSCFLDFEKKRKNVKKRAFESHLITQPF